MKNTQMHFPSNPDFHNLPLLSATSLHAEKHILNFAFSEQLVFCNKNTQALYISGEISRQADALNAARDSKLPVFLERGPFLSPSDFDLALQKLQNSKVYAVDAGTTFGLSDRVLDPRTLFLLQQSQKEFGINLNAIAFAPEFKWRWTPDWLHDSLLVNAYLIMAQAFGAHFFIVPQNHNLDLPIRMPQ